MRFLVGLAFLVAACSSPSLPASEAAPPVPTPADAGLLAACEVLSLVEDTGPLVTAMPDTFDDGYDTFRAAADPLVAKVDSIIVALAQVPDREPFVDWKRAALEVAVYLSDAVTAYDRGMALGSPDGLADLAIGTEWLGLATDANTEANAASAAFSGDC